MAGEDVGAGAMNQLRMCAAQMGATPADRSKVAVPAEPDDDPADRFFN
jgi:phage terminase small subunit